MIHLSRKYDAFWNIAIVLIIIFVFQDDSVSQNSFSSFHDARKTLTLQSGGQYQPPCDCTVTQGSFTQPLLYMESNTSATTFYNYIGTTANTGLELSQTMLLFMYLDTITGENSLVIILDRANDGSGGQGTVVFKCMPSGSSVVFSDDGGELSGTPPTFTGNFSWGSCCTDGGIIGGVGCGHTFTINPTFQSGIDAISFVYGTPQAATYLDMPDINCPITINCGGATCCENAFEFTSDYENATCASNGDGSIDLQTDCATLPQFEWSNGATTQDVSGLTPGEYLVTITDINGCEQTAAFTILSENQDPVPDISGPGAFCTGSSIYLDVEGNFTSFLWSNGETSPAIQVNSPGIYSVTVTNAQGCSGTDSIEILENALPVAEITGPEAFCEGSEVILDAGGGFVTYDWSTGSFDQTTRVYQEGYYAVTVTNEAGCADTDSIFVDMLPAPNPDISGPEFLCSGESITLDVGLSFDVVQWSTGSSDPEIMVSQSGTYTVTVTDNNGCTASAGHVVSAFTSYMITLQSTSCNPADTGTWVTQYLSQQGCDSTVTRIVRFNLADTIRLSENTCNPRDTGTIISIFTNRYGCDSIVFRNILLLASDSIKLSRNSCNPADTGVFIQNLTNKFGCDSIVLENVFLLTSDEIFIQKTSCRPQDVGIVKQMYTNSYGCDSLVTIETIFSSADTSRLFNVTCDKNKVGVSQIILKNTKGCDSLILTTTTLLPSDTVQIYNKTCDPLQAGVTESVLQNRNGCDSLVITTTTLLPSDTTIIHKETCLTNETGTVKVILQNASGCDSVVITTTLLRNSSECLLRVEVVSDTIGCNETSGRIRFNFDQPDFPIQIKWFDALGNQGTDVFQASVNQTLSPLLPPGNYTFDFLDATGHGTQVAGFIFKISPLEISTDITSDYNGRQISCFDKSDGALRSEIITGGLAPFSFLWSDGSTSSERKNLASGWYYVEVTDLFGCSDKDSVQIVAPEKLILRITSLQPDCRTGGLGTIRIADAGGGTPPYRYRLNNASWVNTTIFPNLPAGSYTVEVTDSNQCRTIESQEINSYRDADIIISNDTIINAGDSVRIKAYVVPGTSGIQEIYWEGAACKGCNDIWVKPLQTSEYSVVVTDSLGCMVRKTIKIQVKVNDDIYIPNVFSPGIQGENQKFTIYGSNALKHIREMRIYDRWGTMVYGIENLPANDPSEGWDGTFKGISLQTGVYVYLCVLEFSDGSVKTINGDILLLR